MYDASDRKDVRRAEKEARQAEVQRHEIIKGLMSLAPGRSWVLDKLEACHVFASSFSTEALQMAFAEGQRNIGLQLLADVMAACPERYIEMMQERNEREVKDVRRDDRPDDPDAGDED